MATLFIVVARSESRRSKKKRTKTEDKDDDDAICDDSERQPAPMEEGVESVCHVEEVVTVSYIGESGQEQCRSGDCRLVLQCSGARLRPSCSNAQHTCTPARRH